MLSGRIQTRIYPELPVFGKGLTCKEQPHSNVIITKLPFQVPTHPVMKAKIKQIVEQKGNSLTEFNLAAAILRLKARVWSSHLHEN